MLTVMMVIAFLAPRRLPRRSSHPHCDDPSNLQDRKSVALRI